MKKQITVIMLVLVLLLAATGCAADNAIQRLDAAEDRVEAKLDAAEDKLEDSMRKAVADAPAAAAKTVPAVTGSSVLLTKEQAQQIALDYLGLTANQVTRLRSEQEIDDGVPQFDVEFYQGDWEYEFEIHAEDGRILSYDKDHRHD